MQGMTTPKARTDVAQAVMDAAMGQDGEPIPMVVAAALRAAAAQMIKTDDLADTVEEIGRAHV